MDEFLEKLREASYDRRCKCCGLMFNIDNVDCPHCNGLSDSEMIAMLNHRIDSEENNSKLGYVFAIIVIALIFILYYLTAS